MFCMVIKIILSYVEEFLKQKSILQSLTKQKLSTEIMKKLQNMIYIRYSLSDKMLEDDKKLVKMAELIDKNKFFEL